MNEQLSSGDATPPWLSVYLGMEQSADTIRSHEPHVVSGLLQIPDYTAAIVRSVGVAPTSDSYVRWNIEQRALRQKRINAGDLNLSVVQPEIPLHLQMGDRSTMATQLTTHPWTQGPTVFHQRYNRQTVIEDPDEAAAFMAAWEQASDLALSPEDSLALIVQLAEQWEAGDDLA